MQTNFVGNIVGSTILSRSWDENPPTKRKVNHRIFFALRRVELGFATATYTATVHGPMAQQVAGDDRTGIMSGLWVHVGRPTSSHLYHFCS